MGPPKNLSEEDWILFGSGLGKIEGAVQWWLGDWWAYGEHAYGKRKELFEEGAPFEDLNFQTVKQYGFVAGNIETCDRSHVLYLNSSPTNCSFAPRTAT